MDDTKTNPDLGLKVHLSLVAEGLETPGVQEDFSFDEDSIKNIEYHFDKIMKVLGLDLTDDSLKDTPQRVAKMFINEIFWGLQVNKFPKCTVIENKMKYNEMVTERRIPVNSFCEHHFVAISGSAIVSYIPDKYILGLSKLNRIVDYFSRRPQVQERLTEQIYHATSLILGTENVAVMIKAQHFCVKCRGVSHQDCDTITTKLGGKYLLPSARNEFMTSNLISN